MDFGLGTSQVSLDSNNESSAYASSPDPGFVGTIPGVAGEFLPPTPGLNVPSVVYPLTASTSYGLPPTDVGGTGFRPTPRRT